MEKVLVVKQNSSGSKYTTGALLDDRGISALASTTAKKILKRLATQETYPMKISEELHLHPQRVYYHIRKMREAGLIKVAHQKIIRGARALIYSPAASTLAYELHSKWESYTQTAPPPEPLAKFFDGFYQSGKFRGVVVVGSPEEHGPFKIKARDGHYSAHLCMFLGRFWLPPDDFAVKLDVDVIAEKFQRENLILIGGPGANMVTASINRYLPIKFREDNYWLGLEGREKKYAGENIGVIARIPNPFSDNSKMIVLAGLRYIGTKAAVLALTALWEKTLSTFRGEREWGRVVQGFDLDGDGKIDNVEFPDGGE